MEFFCAEYLTENFDKKYGVTVKLKPLESLIHTFFVWFCPIQTIFRLISGLKGPIFFENVFDAQTDWKATWKLFSLKSFATSVSYSIGKSAKLVAFRNNLKAKPSKIVRSLVFSIFQVQSHMQFRWITFLWHYILPNPINKFDHFGVWTAKTRTYHGPYMKSEFKFNFSINIMVMCGSKIGKTAIKMIKSAYFQR